MRNASRRNMIEPVADRVLIQQLDPEEETRGGILLPDIAKRDSQQEGIVVAVGPGPSMNDEGKLLVPIEVKPGDHVLFTRYGRSYFKHDEIEYCMIRKHNIYAKIDCSKPHSVVANHHCEMRGKLDGARQPTIADAYK